MPEVAIVPPVRLNVSQAIKNFQRDTRDLEGYRYLLSVLIETGFREPLKNDSYFDALVLTEAMLKQASHSIKFLTGPRCDGFLKVLEQPFKDALHRISLNNGKVKIILLGQVGSFLQEMKNIYPKTLEIIPATSEKRIAHFTVCDGKMTRAEEIHGEITGDSPADSIRAKVYFNNPVHAKILEESFDLIWTRLEQILAVPSATASQA